MKKKDNKHNFDLVTPADAVDYDPLGNNQDIQSIESVYKIKNKKDKRILLKQSILFQYIFIIIISSVLGLARWSFLDKKFPLFDSSDIQKKAIKIKELSKKNIGSSIDFKLMKEVVADEIFPILDARDIESYNEGHITGAINFDSELLMDGDEEISDKLNNFIDSLSNQRIIIYCWNPECDRAEYLRAFLIDFGVLESNISIYENGWDEWHLLYK